MTALRTNFDFSRWRSYAISPPVLLKPQSPEDITRKSKPGLFQNCVYYIPYKTLEEQGISFADFALSKSYYNELAFLFEDASSRNPYTKKEADFVQAIARRYLQNPHSLLDIACGAGRHGRELSNMGYKVVGVDGSEKLLEIARSKDKKTTYKQFDMRSFELGQQFDVAICLWDAFPYLSQKEDVELFLEKCLKHIKKGGLLIIDFRNYFKEDLKPLWLEGTLSFGQLEVKYTGRRQDINFTDRVSESVFVYNVKNIQTRETGIFVDQELVRTYSLDDLKGFFKDDFKVLGAHGDFDLENKFDPKKSERLIVVAQVT